VERDLTHLAARLGAARAVVASSRSGRVEVAQWTGWDGSGLAVLGGPFREGASALYPWAMATLRRAGDDLADGGPLRPGTVRALRLLGVGAVAIEDGAGLSPTDVTPGAGYRVIADPRAVLIDGPAPLVFAAAARPVDTATWDRFEELARRALTDVPDNADQAVAERALDALIAAAGGDLAWPGVLPLPPGAAPLGGDGAEPSPTVRTLEVSHRRVRFEVTTGSACVAWLPFALLPGVSVRLDGAELALPLRASSADPLPFRCVAVPAGTHELTLEGPDGPRSGVFGFISAAALLSVFVLGWRTRPRAESEATKAAP
jgi:hypothetical protein